jgi:hypothetical protein
MLCNSCQNRPNCNAICPTINKLLRKLHIHAPSWIRPKISRLKRKSFGEWREVPFTALSLQSQEGKIEDYAGDI